MKTNIVTLIAILLVVFMSYGCNQKPKDSYSINCGGKIIEGEKCPEKETPKKTTSFNGCKEDMMFHGPYMIQTKRCCNNGQCITSSITTCIGMRKDCRR